MTSGDGGLLQRSPSQPESRGPLGVNDSASPDNTRVPANARGPIGVHKEHMRADIEAARQSLEETGRELKDSRNEILRFVIREIGKEMREQYLEGAEPGDPNYEELVGAVDRGVANSVSKAIADYFSPNPSLGGGWGQVGERVPEKMRARHSDLLDAFIEAAQRYLDATAYLTDDPTAGPPPQAKRDMSDVWDWGEELVREIAVMNSMDDDVYGSLIQGTQTDLLTRAAWTAYYHYAEASAAWQADPTGQRLNHLEEAAALLDVVLKELHTWDPRNPTIVEIGNKMQELADRLG